MRLSILSSLEPLVRDITALSVSDSCAVISVDLDEEGTSLHLVTPAGLEREVRVPLSHSCISCSMRHALVPFLEEWRGRLDDVLIALPPTVESPDIVPSLAEMTEENPLLVPCAVTSVITAVSAQEIAEQLLSHVSLQERSLALFEEDDRCTGEVVSMNVGHADITVVLGDSPMGLELIEHLRPHDSALIPGLENLTSEMLFSGHHDVDEAIERVHPITIEAWGGPTGQGVWTLDLSSSRPFHPSRLQQNLSALSPDGVCIRGCFWLPSRPQTVCTWNSNGTAITVGSAGQWESKPTTHLIVTGVGPLQDSIRRAFWDSLTDESPFDSVVQWAGETDGLDHWFQF